mmetsp:Transcript_47456/g.54639  ORF Transcript_47456/g.54639 Transcript_47456/m.54639 type:complete len:467 (+) Transcript_47456:88-1488(+)
MEENILRYPLPSGDPKKWNLIQEKLNEKITDFEQLTTTLVTLHGTCFGDAERWEGVRLPSLKIAIDEMTENLEDFNFFGNLLPKIATWALDLEELFKDAEHSFNALEAGKNCETSFTALQSRSLLANSFFCTLAPFSCLKTGENSKRHFGNIDWMRLYCCIPDIPEGYERLKCQLYYFYTVDKLEPSGTIRYIRRAMHPGDFPVWETSKAELSPVVFDENKKIEDSDGFMHADFANKDLMLHYIIPSMTQEEVLFSIRPDIFPILLIAERLEDDEVILIMGAKIYSSYTGYLSSFEWQPLRREDFLNRQPTGIFAVDAIPSMGDVQFTTKYVNRELRKIHLGFTAIDEFANDYRDLPYEFDRVSTGNWGCGAFGGNLYLKFLEQWIAASIGGKKMDYSTFKNPKLKKVLSELQTAVLDKELTAGKLYFLIQRYGEGFDPRKQSKLPESFLKFMSKHLEVQLRGIDN